MSYSLPIVCRIVLSLGEEGHVLGLGAIAKVHPSATIVVALCVVHIPARLYLAARRAADWRLTTSTRELLDDPDTARCI